MTEFQSSTGRQMVRAVLESLGRTADTANSKLAPGKDMELGFLVENSKSAGREKIQITMTIKRVPDRSENFSLVSYYRVRRAHLQVTPALKRTHMAAAGATTYSLQILPSSSRYT